MSPAGAAVLRDVLVTSCTGIVDAVDAPPVPGLWQLSEVHRFMRTRCSSERKDFRSKSFYYHDEIFKGSTFIATPSFTGIHIMHMGTMRQKQKYMFSRKVRGWGIWSHRHRSLVIRWEQSINMQEAPKKKKKAPKSQTGNSLYSKIAVPGHWLVTRWSLTEKVSRWNRSRQKHKNKYDRVSHVMPSETLTSHH